MNNNEPNVPLDQAMAEINAIAKQTLGPAEVNAVVAFMRDRIMATVPESDYELRIAQIDRITGVPGVTSYRVWWRLEFHDEDVRLMFSTETQRNQIARLANGSFVCLDYEEIFREERS